jgi:hypothetical protein
MAGMQSAEMVAKKRNDQGKIRVSAAFVTIGFPDARDGEQGP